VGTQNLIFVSLPKVDLSKVLCGKGHYQYEKIPYTTEDIVFSTNSLP
jgi:hypothetical protein